MLGAVKALAAVEKGMDPFFLRPDSNVTQTNFTGGYAQIDEASASDADFAYSTVDVAATLEVGLSNPASAPSGGTTTVRFRGAKLDSSQGLSSSGQTVTVTCHVYEGGTLRASDTGRVLGGAWTTYSFTPDLSAVSNWNNLRLRFGVTATGSSGGGGLARGAGISWAELEWNP